MTKSATKKERSFIDSLLIAIAGAEISRLDNLIRQPVKEDFRYIASVVSYNAAIEEQIIHWKAVLKSLKSQRFI